MSFMPRVFYGWYVVYAIGLVMATTAGLAFYSLPVLLDAFVAERDFPVAMASAATGSFFIAAGAGGLLAGQLADRFDVRWVIIGSAAFAALALASMGLLYTPWQLFAFYIVFGFAYGGCGLVPTTAVVTRWFHTRRALALSISSTGLSLGGAVFAPLTALLILQFGLSGAAPWVALLFFLGVIPVTLLVVRSRPESVGLRPYGETQAEGEGQPAAVNVSFAGAWRSRYFVAIAVGFLFVLGSQVGGIAHVYRLGNVRVDAETATLAVALVSMASLIGRLVVGWLLTLVPARAMTFALFAVQAVTLVLLAFAEGRVPLLACAALFGMTGGSILMMQPLLLADAFGVREIGRIYSVSQVVGVFGYALGPLLAGVLYTVSGDYWPAYLALAGGTVLGFAVLAWGGPPAREGGGKA